MGGNAIAKARRVTKEEYDNVIKHIQSQKFMVPRNTLITPTIEPTVIEFPLGAADVELVRGTTVDTYANEPIYGTIVKSYRNKQDFGDIDVVIDDRVDIVPIFAHFRPKKCAVNGNVMSFAYDGIQVDFIRTPKEHIRSTLEYFAYNDLGNLLGKIARALGFKYGNKGLIYQHRDEVGNVIDEIIVTKVLSVILGILGLSYSRYERGFNTLEDMFEFVASSGYFNPSLYALVNASSADRVRDEKRKTYQAFLAWIQAKRFAETPAEEQKALLQYQHRQILNEFPHVMTLCNQIDKERAEEKAFRAKFNGAVVHRLTGLEGRQLGSFMEKLRSIHYKGELMRMSEEELHGVILAAHEYFGLKKQGKPLSDRISDADLKKITGLEGVPLAEFKSWFCQQHGKDKIEAYDEFDLRGLVGAGWLDYQRTRG